MELRRASSALGSAQLHFLDYIDGDLDQSNSPEVVGKIVLLIRQIQPHVVITFGPDGGYGHPDHIAISSATTAACMRSGEPDRFPEHIAADLEPYQPARLYYSYFPPKRQLLLQQLVQWLVQAEKRFRGTLGFAYALLLLCEEATLLRYSSDHFDINWYPADFLIIEQGEELRESGITSGDVPAGLRRPYLTWRELLSPLQRRRAVLLESGATPNWTPGVASAARAARKGPVVSAGKMPSVKQRSVLSERGVESMAISVGVERQCALMSSGPILATTVSSVTSISTCSA